MVRFRLGYVEGTRTQYGDFLCANEDEDELEGVADAFWAGEGISLPTLGI